MAESDTHRDLMIDLIAMLREYFRDDPHVYISGNLLLYYEEGNPRRSVAPDVFVVKGISSGRVSTSGRLRADPMRRRPLRPARYAIRRRSSRGLTQGHYVALGPSDGLWSAVLGLELHPMRRRGYSTRRVNGGCRSAGSGDTARGRGPGRGRGGCTAGSGGSGGGCRSGVGPAADAA